MAIDITNDHIGIALAYHQPQSLSNESKERYNKSNVSIATSITALPPIPYMSNQPYHPSYAFLNHDHSLADEDREGAARRRAVNASRCVESAARERGRSELQARRGRTDGQLAGDRGIGIADDLRGQRALVWVASRDWIQTFVPGAPPRERAPEALRVGDEVRPVEEEVVVIEHLAGLLALHVLLEEGFQLLLRLLLHHVGTYRLDGICFPPN